MNESDYTITLKANEQWAGVSFHLSTDIAGHPLTFLCLEPAMIVSQTMTPPYPPIPSGWAGVDGEPTPSGPALGVQR